MSADALVLCAWLKHRLARAALTLFELLSCPTYACLELQRVLAWSSGSAESETLGHTWRDQEE